MPEAHALVTPSGAHRWLNCTPSARLEADFPDSSSEAAKEGTIAHALAEKKLKSWIKTGRRTAFKAEDGTMTEATDGYRDYVIALFNQLKADQFNPSLKVEVRLDLSEWIPGGFGTSDAVILSGDTLHIIDFKYGKNVRVDAPDNPQMRIYALGALDLYGEIYEFDHVQTHIYQPRVEGGHISTEKITVEELAAWGESIKPLAKAAFDGAGEQKPGSWCMFCRAKAVCRARAQEMFGVLEKQEPAETLSLDEVAAYLPKLDEAIKWAKSLQDWALQKALDGQTVPGYKVVEGRSVRKIEDPEALAAAMKNDGYADDKIWKPKELQTLTALEKTVGKKKFAQEYGKLVSKPKGKPALVPESDNRKPYQSPDTMFETIQGGE